MFNWSIYGVLSFFCYTLVSASIVVVVIYRICDDKDSIIVNPEALNVARKKFFVLMKSLCAEEEKFTLNSEDMKKPADRNDPEVQVLIKAITEEFQGYDTDGESSGELDKHAVFEMLRTPGVNHGPSFLENLFRLIDTDGNGKVSLEEYMDWKLDMWKFKKDEEEKKNRMILRTFWMIAKEGSKDGDDLSTLQGVSRKQFIAKLKKLDSKLNEGELRQLFHDFDKDRNGFISLKDFTDSAVLLTDA